MPDVKVQESTSLSGERIRYSPGGSGNGGNNNPSSCSDEWICPKIPKPNEVISDDYYWKILEKSSEFDDDDIWDSENWIEPELSSQSNLRRLLFEVLATTPTGKLDIQNTKKFDFTTGPIPGFKYRDRNGRDVIVKVFELTTISDPTRYITLKMPMPYFPSQNTIAYLDKITGKCVYFHENGSLWSADR